MIRANALFFRLIRVLEKRAQSKNLISLFRPRLEAEQDQDAGGDGQDLHDRRKTAKVQFEQRDQPGQDEPDAQQDHSHTLGHLDFGHFTLLEKIFNSPGTPFVPFLQNYHIKMALASGPFQDRLPQSRRRETENRTTLGQER